MYCGHCGTQNTDTAKFCASCGKPLHAQPPTGSMPQRGQLTLSFRLTRGVILTWIGAAVLLIIHMRLSSGGFPEFLFRYYDGLDDFHPELQSLCDSYMDSVFAGLARANSGYTTLRLVFVLLLALVRPLKRRKLSITAGLIASLLWLNTAFYYYMVCVEIFASNKPSIAWYILVSATAAMLIGSLMKD